MFYYDDISDKLATYELYQKIMKELLLKSAKQFVKSCKYFFELIMPKDYQDNIEVKLETVKDFILKHMNEIRQYSRKDPTLITKIPFKIYLEKNATE